MTPEHLKRMLEIDQALARITVTIADYQGSVYDWGNKYNLTYSFRGNGTATPMRQTDVKRLCFAVGNCQNSATGGPTCFCMRRSVLDIFKYDKGVIDALTTQSFWVYTKNIDHFAKQANFLTLDRAMTSNAMLNSDGYDNWAPKFIAWAQEETDEQGKVDGDMYTSRNDYYDGVKTWLDGAGVRSKRNIKWVDHSDPRQGIKASRFSAKINPAYTRSGGDQYDTMEALRSEVSKAVPDSFPFTFQFLFWEEMAVIEKELWRNLLLCTICVLVFILLLIVQIRVSVTVFLAIFLTLIDMVGILYFWGVTINGVVTVYILVCVGLAVDYSAHIGHAFEDAYGTSDERAAEAVLRMGTAVTNAVVSTMMAVLVFSLSKTYIFRVFFKCFFVVTLIGGAHGLVLLPVLLALLGGDRARPLGAANKSAAEFQPPNDDAYANGDCSREVSPRNSQLDDHKDAVEVNMKGDEFSSEVEMQSATQTTTL